MGKREFGLVTAVTTVVTVVFMMVCVWNTNFPLMEKGLYTICYLFLPLLTILTTTLAGIVRKSNTNIPNWLVAISGFGLLAITAITFISIYNTTWELRYKALFWLGELMLLYCGLGISFSADSKKGVEVRQAEYE